MEASGPPQLYTPAKSPPLPRGGGLQQTTPQREKGQICALQREKLGYFWHTSPWVPLPPSPRSKAPLPPKRCDEADTAFVE